MQVPDEMFPVGSCVVLSASGDRQEMATARCDEPHTDVVLAQTNDPDDCPDETDDFFEEPSGRTHCLKSSP